ncbi:LysM domain-containing protein [Brevibacterium sandarakinum]|uniref:LysM peptidoglycan-binding domain-containing protein n=1 Tax=Brevibacterium sandarakinum TaxID=629680 RepID=UPI00264DCB23|nr:LysM domain-containing protein [Brevibacterium sandarakinum]MDN5656263.1 LysM peptidoglycan-binding domain-containing protein [Brevibacterium sandarakinum]
MYLLIACTISWLCLIGAFLTTWDHLPAPRSTTDLVVIIVVGTATVLFSRLGVVSLLTLLVRLLPHGRMRTIATRTVLRIVPTMLRSSVLAAASASLVVHAAHASPLPADAPSLDDHRVSVAATAAPSLDPGWPTAVPDDPPPDPGWPTAPPAAPPAAGPEPSPHQNGPTTDDEAEVHIVGVGESLWSIAVNQPSSRGLTQDIVDDIYSDNRDVIGANPNLIMPGQRLEIQP